MSLAKLILVVGLLVGSAYQVISRETKTSEPVGGRSGARSGGATSQAADTPTNALSDDEWHKVDSSVERGLTFLAAQQQPDGSFPTTPNAQPAVTSLCVLAFMAHGHTPGKGPHGDRLERAMQYIVSCQKPSGLIMLLGNDGTEIDRDIDHEVGCTGTYDHAISSLTLCELYGMNPDKNASQLKNVIGKALNVTYLMQRWPKENASDLGGWRYVDDYDQTDSDLSVTGWHLMFLRSARNAGFPVPTQSINDAVAFIRRTFQREYGTFNYVANRSDLRTRGMAGAGILALGHAGFHNSVEARRAAQDLLGYSFEVYNDYARSKRDRYHYSLFMCCQGMYQMGSPYWEQFFPRTVCAILGHQNSDGSWDAERNAHDRLYGNSYTTALVVLSLGASNQLLPIFQR
jgi:hypothetical protein